MSDDSTTARQDFINGLHRLADLLASNPTVRLPYDGTASALSVFAHDEATAQAWIGWLHKPKRTGADSPYRVRVTGRIAGINVLVYLDDSIAMVELAPPTSPDVVDWLAAVPE